MRNTQETYYSNAGEIPNGSPRFAQGDIVLFPSKQGIIEQVVRNVFWDGEFGGWLVCCYLIGIHEQNFVHLKEKDKWIPHENGLWSWWEKKNEI